jgi:hypothetical protein
MKEVLKKIKHDIKENYDKQPIICFLEKDNFEEIKVFMDYEKF